MKLSDYVINFLAAHGITDIFEVAGGALAHLLDSLYDRNDISAISMHHEMAASIAAEGFSRASENIGAAMATSGPGATNLITGIGSCFFDSIPCLFITGQVNTYECKLDHPTRQVGFQETDIVSIVKPITKDAFIVTDPKKIRCLLEKSIYIAKSGRPGPVLIDLPLNIQRAEIDPDSLECFQPPTPKRLPSNIDQTVGTIAQLLTDASRPVILSGGGVRLSKADDVLLELAHKTEIPVVTSLMGVDTFPHDDPSFMGLIGTYGNRYANFTVSNCDLLVALGTRLDTRQTGTKPSTFARAAKIVHVDIDSSELNNKVTAHYPVNMDVKEFLTLINARINNYDKSKIASWKQIVKTYKDRYTTQITATANKSNIDPNTFIQKLSEYLPSDAIVCVDVGQNQMWSAQSLVVKRGQRFLTEGGMGSMGSALPMAIGACFAQPDKMVIVITGDGGFQLNIQELQTVYHHNLPIKIILLNNQCYGMIKQFQTQYFNSKYQSTVKGYSSPDFQRVVSAYKIPTMKISQSSELNEIAKVFDDRVPMFLEVAVDSSSLVLPKLSVNRPIEDQEPLLPRSELKANMIVDILSEPEDI